MEVKQQSLRLPIANMDRIIGAGDTTMEKRHGPLLPNTIRAVFCGPSNCGKTNVLISLLIQPNGLKFQNIYLYSKSLNQPKYLFLQELLRPIDDMKFFTFGDREQVISTDKALPNSIMIFDDVSCEKQDNMKAYFCMGRHKSVDCFYLCQSYAQVPKHLIRDNVNLMVIFRQDEMNLRHIYKDHVNTDMSYEKFKNLCTSCWKDDEHSFLVIDKDSKHDHGRYRSGFDKFIISSK